MRGARGTPTDASRHPGWSWLVFALVALAVSIAWEFAQTPLYGTGELRSIHLGIWLRAAVVDAVLVTGATAAASTARQLARRRPEVTFWTVIIASLLTTAGYIEWTAIRTARWTYSELMPTVGTVGLAPFVQLAVTATVALLLARPQLPGELSADGR